MDSGPKALERFGVLGVFVSFALVGGAIYMFFFLQDAYFNYAGNPEMLRNGTQHHTEIVKLFTPKKSVEMDTRGITDISTPAGTHPKAGYWGGKSATEHLAQQTPHISSALFYRSAKYHPWSDRQKEEVRREAFQTIYSARLHH